MTVNWRRGLWRAWIVLSIIWVSLVVVVVGVAFGWWVDSTGFGYTDLVVSGSNSPPDDLVSPDNVRIGRVLLVAVVPPLLLLMSGAATFWIISGFRSGER